MKKLFCAIGCLCLVGLLKAFRMLTPFVTLVAVASIEHVPIMIEHHGGKDLVIASVTEYLDFKKSLEEEKMLPQEIDNLLDQFLATHKLVSDHEFSRLVQCSGHIEVQRPKQK